MDNDQLKEYIFNLPSELKQAIFSVDYPKQLQEIVKRNKLLIDQAGQLEAETTLVMAGIEPLKDYIDNLVKNVGLNRNLATVVAHDVDELIFKNIRDALRKMGEEEEVETKVSPKEPSKEEVLSGIENPSSIKESSISVSSLKSNSNTPEMQPENLGKNIEIRRENLPETLPESAFVKRPKIDSIPQSVSPVANIIETKSTQTVVSPKQQIVIEEKTRLPEKEKTTDPYRETLV